MNIVNFLLLIVILVLVITYYSSIKQVLNQIKIELYQLRFDINRINSKVEIPKTEVSKPQDIKVEPKVETPNIPTPDQLREKNGPKDQPIPEKELQQSVKEEVTINQPVEKKEKILEPEPVSQFKQEPQKAQEPKITKPQSKDWEKFIGENLMSKIGIVILVLGIGYFVKYAIDKNWIGEYGRVAIGLLTGGVIIYLAHILRKTYKTFSSILTGGGIAVLYITISIAFHQYELFSEGVAFAILIAITIFSVIISLSYDKIELAIFSQLGGFLAPFMVSTNSEAYVVLFTYILILNIGLLIIAYYKRWHLLNLLAFIGTQIIYNTWLVNKFIINNTLPVNLALTFSTIFYLIFFLVNVINNLKERTKFNGIEIGLILSNNLLYFTSGLTIFNYAHLKIYNGLFTILLGVYNLVWVLVLYKRNNIDKSLIYLLIGLVLSFVSLSIPIQLKGHSITLFWCAELVILLWIAQKSKIRILETGHLIILVLIGISLLLDWSNIYYRYSETVLPILFNKAFITGFVALIAVSLTLILLKNEDNDLVFASIIPLNFYKQFLRIVIMAGAYFILFLELKYQLTKRVDIYPLSDVIYAIFNLTYISVLLFIAIKTKKLIFNQIVSGIAYFIIMLFTFYFLGRIVDLRNLYIESLDLTYLSYFIHYLVFIPLAFLMYYLWKTKSETFKEFKSLNAILDWLLALVLIVTLTSELNNIILSLRPRPMEYEVQFAILKQVHKAGYLILWGVLAFIFMLLGMRFNNRTFRIQSIVLLALILCKLIFVDVWKMNETGRIFTFIFIGMVLLIISFLYQKLKNLIISGDVTKETNENS